MRDIFTFYKKNIERLKELALDCPECIKNAVPCRHYDYIKRYIEELEEKPVLDEEKFNSFWKSYPKKTGRVYALKIWQKMKVDDALYDKIMKSLEFQKGSEQWSKNAGRFVPNPFTWLNQERWDDAQEVETPGKTKLNEKYKGL